MGEKNIRSTIEFPAPPIETQHRIANILSAYDDLIENNRKQIKLLEEAARRLYKEWFVDLRFPGYEHTKITDGVPEGWEKCSLGDVIKFDPKVQLAKDRVKQFVPMSALSTSSMVLDMAEFREITSNSGSKFQNDDIVLRDEDVKYYKVTVNDSIGADIYSTGGQTAYSVFWKRKEDELQAQINELVDPTYAITQIKEKKIVQKILLDLPEFMEFVRDSKGLSLTEHLAHNFEDIIKFMHL